MENCEKTNIIPFVDILGCDVINHSSCIGDDFMLLECLEEEVTVRVNTFIGEKDAFKLYNDHAFRLGFSIRKGYQKFKFYCYKQGMKSDKRKGEKAYTKVDFCTGGWTVSRDDVSPNHVFCDVNQGTFCVLRGELQRIMLVIFKSLKDSVVSIAAGLRVLKKQVGDIIFFMLHYAVLPSFTHKSAYFCVGCLLLHLRASTFIIDNANIHNLMDEFVCHNDSWLSMSYNLREKWCPAFSNDFFYGIVPSFINCTSYC
ncbi:hypothetical protein M9H77_02542 [Catharanthus roseus]|uniref:Uncharacterized protein n=1 Tax=Catharanthus roseus TaxID=4058 RepID=A0ACC0C8T3_CATRO|nr:hypothetical protein M9H77_02542 [Catharanthus roseus]